MDVSERPLRKDAERNRQRILDAALELFAQQGLGVTLNDVAHQAGLGVGTVYRRFPDKSALIDALFDQWADRLEGFARAALEDPDPWHGLTSFLEHAAELQSVDRGFKEIALGSPNAPERIAQLRQRMSPLGTELLRRARDAGQLRAEIAPPDIPIIQLMVGTVIDCARDVEPDLWRRYLAIILAGLRGEAAPAQELPVGPLTLEQIPQVMSAWQPPRR
jgi:AcrR family transcriptional regulator